MKRLIMAIIASMFMLSAPAAHAFPFLFSWHQPSDGVRAGAGGIFGTGGARDKGLQCAHCHVKGAGQIDATITPNVAWQVVGGMQAYKPGQKYTITVALIGEHLGLTLPAAQNLNGFALTAENAAGATVGVFQSDTTTPVDSTNCKQFNSGDTLPAGGTSYLVSNGNAGSCSAVVFIERPGITTWTFNWTAPAKGTGTVTLFYGVVDGDANGKSSVDDDVKQGTLKLVEGN